MKTLDFRNTEMYQHIVIYAVGRIKLADMRIKFFILATVNFVVALFFFAIQRQILAFLCVFLMS